MILYKFNSSRAARIYLKRDMMPPPNDLEVNDVFAPN
jgi:hypothetical protein